MRSEFIQKYALLAALIGTPLFVVAKFNHADPGFLVWTCGLLLLIFCSSLAATLFSGIAYGAGFERIERQARPGRYWLVVGAHVFVCCAGVFGVAQGLSGYTMK
jgi:hypothetical protein